MKTTKQIPEVATKEWFAYRQAEREMSFEIHNLVAKQFRELEGIFSQPRESKLTSEDLELLKKLTE